MSSLSATLAIGSASLRADVAQVEERLDAEAARLDAHAQASERRVLRRLDAEDQQIPDAPQGVGSQVGDAEAGVWWTPGADNGKEVTQFKVYRYRLDGTDWIKRGESVYGPDKVRAWFVCR